MPAADEASAAQVPPEAQIQETINKGLDSTPYVDLGRVVPSTEPTGTGQPGTLNALDTTHTQGGSKEPPPPEFDG